MNLSFAAGALMFYPVKTTLTIARASGFGAVELLVTPAMLRRGGRHYLRLAEERGVRVQSVHARLHYRDVALLDKIESDRASLRFAADLDSCTCLVLHPPVSRSGDMSAIRQWLDAICTEREALGTEVQVGIENRANNNDDIPQQQLDNLERLRMIAGEWGVGVTLDIAHAASFGVDTEAAIDTVAARLVNVHLSDVRHSQYRGGILNGLLRDHQIPGDGYLDMHSVSTRLRHHAYAGPVTLELSPLSLRAFWPWLPTRLLANTHAYLRDTCLFGERDVSTGQRPQRQVR